MGKASRNKRDNLELRRAEAEKKKQEAASKKKKALRNKIIGIVCGVLAVLLIGSTLVYNSLQSGGFFLRRTVSVSSENYEVDNALLSIQFYTQYQNFMSQYGSYAAYFGLDSTKSLKTQECTMLGDGSSWYSYFMNAAVEQSKNVLRFCEEAKARGLTLDDSDKEMIDSYLDDVKAQAKEMGTTTGSFIRTMYGPGVKMKDLRRSIEMTALYTKCYNAMLAEFDYTDADFDAYVKENPKALLQVSYAAISMSTSDGTTEGEITTDILKQFETKFKAVKSKAEFDKTAYDYLRNYSYKDFSEKSEEEINAEVEGFFNENARYSEGEFMDWAVDSARKKNDVKVEFSEDGQTLYAYILTETAALPEYDSVNVRHILLTTETYETLEATNAKAEELLAEWKNGAATAESFGELAAEYSEDGAENGLYENVLKGDMVEAFNDWIFADGRAAGDTGIVETEYGVHVMYMEGHGTTAWKVLADNALISEAFEAAVAEMEEKYAVEVDEIATTMIQA